MENDATNQASGESETHSGKILSSILGVILVAIVIGTFWLFPIVDCNLLSFLKPIVAISCALLAALISGTIFYDSGIVKAAGGMSVFAIVFFFTPDPACGSPPPLGPDAHCEDIFSNPRLKSVLISFSENGRRIERTLTLSEINETEDRVTFSGVSSTAERVEGFANGNAFEYRATKFNEKYRQNVVRTSKGTCDKDVAAGQSSYLDQNNGSPIVREYELTIAP